MGEPRPEFEPPMAPIPANALPTAPGFVFEAKFDGARCRATRRGGSTVYLQSRQLRPLTGAFPEIVDAVAQLSRDVWLDGEVCVWARSRVDFEALLARLRVGPGRARAAAAQTPAAFIVFDLLRLDGVDLRRQPWRQRRQALEELFARQDLPSGLVLIPMTTDLDVARSWMTLATAGTGIEGVVAKRVESRYRPGRQHRNSWLKIRARTTAEALIGGVTGTLSAPQTLVLGRFVEGRLRIVGRTAALSPAARRQVGELLRPGDHSWPDTLPAPRWDAPRVGYQRVRPEVVVEVSADVSVTGAAWRHPLRYVRLRDDLQPEDLRGTG